MTLDEFLIELNEAAGNTKWRMLGTAIRTQDGYCPICFLAKQKGLNQEDARLAYFNSAANMKFNFVDASAIAWCSDLDVKSGIREQLLQITGLQ